MSGTGKTILMERLVALGHKAVDLDDGWCEPQPDGRQLWRTVEVSALLAQEDADVLFVAGCKANMVEFLPSFDVVVLLTAPVDTLIERLATHTNNPYGKSAEERRRVLEDIREVEPRLRRVANHVVETTAPLDEVVRTVLAVALGG
jgi:shikimate kinase